MLSQRAGLFPSVYNGWVQLAAAGGVGLLLGAASVVLSPLWVLLALAGGLIALVALKRPELALLGILVATSSIIYENELPLIPIGVGSLHVPDAILLAFLGLIFVRALAEPDFRIIHTPLDTPLLAFYGVTLLSTIIAILQSRLEFTPALRTIRIVSYYLTFFIVTNLLRDERQLSLLIRGLIMLSIVIAGAMVAQFALGKSTPIMPGRVEELVTQETSYETITRILPPGQSLVLVGFVVTTVTLTLERVRASSVIQLALVGLLGLAVVLTFNRNFWGVVIIALALLVWLARNQDRQRLMSWGMVIVCALLVIGLLLSLHSDSQTKTLIDASIQRLSTFTGSQVTEDESFRWRYVEYDYAIPQITAHPLIGLGAGARYRPLDRRLDRPARDDIPEFDGRDYVHNGHLWIMLQSGLLGYGCLVWLSVVFIRRGLRYWRQVSHRGLRGVVLAFTLVYLGVLVGCIVSPMFMQWFWTPVFGLMMGVNETVIRLFVPYPDPAGANVATRPALGSAV
ncbi:MAG: O-antigen ligase family protein [Anaerolineae bacterium]|nr:O-antigen ligase family protein [Anaerolineae bacterium]